MKIVGFPIDVSQCKDGRIVRGLRTRQMLLQSALDLIQAGDIEPSATAIATIAGVPRRTLFEQFPALADLYSAAFELAVSRAFDANRPVEAAAPLANRVERLVADRARLFEEWLPVWHFAERVRGTAPAVGSGLALVRRRLRERLAASFSAELDNLSPGARDLVLDSLDVAFGLDSWMNLRQRQRLSPMSASRTWRFTAQAIVQQALTGSGRASAAA